MQKRAEIFSLFFCKKFGKKSEKNKIEKMRKILIIFLFFNFTKIFAATETHIFSAGWHLFSLPGIFFAEKNLVPEKMAPFNFNSIFGISEKFLAVGDSGLFFQYFPAEKIWREKKITINWLNDIFSTDGKNFLVAASAGDILHFDGENWENLPHLTFYELKKIWGKNRTFFFVGDTGVILKFIFDENFNLIERKEISPKIFTDWRGIWGENLNNIFVVGYDGIFLHSSDGGENWIEKKISDQILNSVFGTKSGKIFAVGRNGTILKFKNLGENWEKISAPTTENLNSIYEIGDEIFAVGDGGTILVSRNDGENWEKIDSGTTKNLHSIFGENEKIFAVGESGIFLERKNNEFLQIENFFVP